MGRHGEGDVKALNVAGQLRAVAGDGGRMVAHSTVCRRRPELATPPASSEYDTACTARRIQMLLLVIIQTSTNNVSYSCQCKVGVVNTDSFVTVHHLGPTRE